MTEPLDLSLLPPPAVVETLDFEALRSAVEADLRERYPELVDPLPESDPIAKLIEAAAYREMVIRQRVNDAARSVMLAYAAGADLDNLAALFAVRRLDGETDAALRARVLLALQGQSTAGPEAGYRRIALGASPDVEDVAAASPSAGNVTLTVLPRIATALKALPSPITHAAVPAMSGEIVRISAVAAQIGSYPASDRWRIVPDAGDDVLAASGVTVTRIVWRSGNDVNDSAFVTADGAGAYFGPGGAGAGKSLYFFRGGLWGGIELSGVDNTLSTAASWRVTDPARRAWLEDIDFGDALVAIVADGGAYPAAVPPPTPAMVKAAASADDARPIGDRVTVQPATISTYAISASIEIAGFGPSAELVRTAAEAAARVYAADAYALGRDIGLDAIYAALHVPGARKVTLTAPAADIAVAATAAARCTGVTIWAS